MPLVFGPTITDGRVYRGRKKQDDDEEKQALKELQILLAKKRKACDCEGQIHELIENCPQCGRLCCSLEGPGKCLHCGNLVLTSELRNRFRMYIDIVHKEPSTSQPRPSSSASPQTRIIDHQYDIFAIQNKKHLRPDERQHLIDNLEELQAKRHQRELFLDFDEVKLEANIKSVAKIQNYGAELKKLQLSDNAGHTIAECTLAELVCSDYNKGYEFHYIEPHKSKHSLATPANQQKQSRQQPNKPKNGKPPKSIKHSGVQAANSEGSDKKSDKSKASPGTNKRPNKKQHPPREANK